MAVLYSRKTNHGKPNRILRVCCFNVRTTRRPKCKITLTQFPIGGEEYDLYKHLFKLMNRNWSEPWQSIMYFYWTIKGDYRCRKTARHHFIGMNSPQYFSVRTGVDRMVSTLFLRKANQFKHTERRQWSPTSERMAEINFDDESFMRYSNNSPSSTLSSACIILFPDITCPFILLCCLISDCLNSIGQSDWPWKH